MSIENIQSVISVDIEPQKTTEKNELNIASNIQEDVILESIESVFSSEISTLEPSEQKILTESGEGIIDDDLQTAMSLLGIETDTTHQDENVEHCSLNDISDQQHEEKVTHSDDKLVDSSPFENKVVEIIKKNVFLSDPEETNAALDQKKNEDQSLKTKFWEWFKKGLKTGEIKFNTADAKIHSVAGFLFLQTPAIFFLFLREHPDLDVDHHTLLSAFELLNVHRIEKKGGKRKRHYVCKIYPVPIV
ncbi:conjugal transfer nickase/helicase domain-containing protein [Xenorhabdus bovienii]|nr:DNA-binding domain-containing protein [Xenorhabdus bovienii]